MKNTRRRSREGQVSDVHSRADVEKSRVLVGIKTDEVASTILIRAANALAASRGLINTGNELDFPCKIRRSGTPAMTRECSLWIAATYPHLRSQQASTGTLQVLIGREAVRHSDFLPAY